MAILCYFGLFHPLPNNNALYSKLVETEEPAHETFHVNPSETANFFSSLVFSWMGPLLRLGNTRTLEAKDLYPLASEYQPERVFEQFERLWEAEKQKTK
jgi:hypothetical protein